MEEAPCPACPRLLKELGGGIGTAARGPAAELGQALGGCCAGGLLAVASQDLPEDLPVLSLGGSAVLGCPDTQRPDNVVVEVADG